MVFEKKRITESEDADQEDYCGVCSRAKCGIICRGCLSRTLNVRARKSCPAHPREMFLMDLAACPNCKSSNIDDISAVGQLPPPLIPTPNNVDVNCVCNRRINYLLCEYCGFYEPGSMGRRMLRICPAHPEVREGLQRCPDCQQDTLEEALLI